MQQPRQAQPAAGVWDRRQARRTGFAYGNRIIIMNTILSDSPGAGVQFTVTVALFPPTDTTSQPILVSQSDTASPRT